MRWYTLYFHGLLGPMVMVVPLFLLIVLWHLRVVSTRTYYVCTFTVQLAYWIHVDYRVFVTGLQGLTVPLSYQIPTSMRVLAYAIVLSVATYLGVLWAKRTYPSEKWNLTRGLPYLKEHWRLHSLGKGS